MFFPDLSACVTTAESSALYAIGILVLAGTAKGIVEALRLIYLGFFLTAQAGKFVIILVEQLLELVAVAEDACRALSVQFIQHLIAGGLAGHSELMWISCFPCTV